MQFALRFTCCYFFEPCCFPVAWCGVFTCALFLFCLAFCLWPCVCLAFCLRPCVCWAFCFLPCVCWAFCFLPCVTIFFPAALTCAKVDFLFVCLRPVALVAWF